MPRDTQRTLLNVSSGTKLDRWTLEERIGQGGNGEVWRASDGEMPVAIKFLKAAGQKAVTRFRSEIAVMQQCAGIRGVLPVLADSSSGGATPQAPTESNLEWFAMPLAEPAIQVLQSASVSDVVWAAHAWASTLADLHDQGISHRDIKPGNLFRWNADWVVGDFGLVHLPTLPRVTRTTERVGPWAIMPPEMRRAAKVADGRAADVYLLAKTLWIFLARETNGFDGPFNPDDPVLSLEVKCGSGAFVHPLAELIRASTRNDPYSRPTMRQFADVLGNWKLASSDFHRRASEDWRHAVVSVLAAHPPRRAVWTSIEEIVSVLRTAVKYDNANHLYYPSGGGNDLKAVAPSIEPDCIELDTGSVTIVRPTRLLLEVFPDNPEWNYFRLETGGLEPSGAYDDSNDETEDIDPEPVVAPTSDEDTSLEAELDEDVTELEPGQYVAASVWDDGFYGEADWGNPVPLPSTARRVSRYFSGAFAIFGKRSPYNLNGITYDARHARVNADEFRRHIEGAISRFEAQNGPRVIPVAVPRTYPPPKGAPNRFATIVDQVIELARKRRREEERSRESRGSVKDFQQFTTRRSRHDEALLDYLKVLDVADIRKLEALMYAGRDGDPVSYTYQLVRGEPLEAARSQIFGKVPLDSYLESFLRMARTTEFDIELPLE